MGWDPLGEGDGLEGASIGVSCEIIGLGDVSTTLLTRVVAAGSGGDGAGLGVEFDTEVVSTCSRSF